MLTEASASLHFRQPFVRSVSSRALEILLGCAMFSSPATRPLLGVDLFLPLSARVPTPCRRERSVSALRAFAGRSCAEVRGYALQALMMRICSPPS